MTLYLGCDLKPSGHAAYPPLRCQCGEAKPGRGGIPSVHVIPRRQLPEPTRRAHSPVRWMRTHWLFDSTSMLSPAAW
jgi:hypothetical protein